MTSLQPGDRVRYCKAYLATLHDRADPAFMPFSRWVADRGTVVCVAAGKAEVLWDDYAGSTEDIGSLCPIPAG